MLLCLAVGFCAPTAGLQVFLLFLSGGCGFVCCFFVFFSFIVWLGFLLVGICFFLLVFFVGFFGFFCFLRFGSQHSGTNN